MYISVFWWGQGHREIIFRMSEQKLLRSKKKNSAQYHQSRRRS